MNLPMLFPQYSTLALPSIIVPIPECYHTTCDSYSISFTNVTMSIVHLLDSLIINMFSIINFYVTFATSIGRNRYIDRIWNYTKSNIGKISDKLN
jgi:hypothetical protein